MSEGFTVWVWQQVSMYPGLGSITTYPETPVLRIRELANYYVSKVNP